MASKPVPKAGESLVGKVFRLRQSDGQKIKSWHMANRVRDGDLALCFEYVHGRVHRYSLLEYDLNGLKLYPREMAFLSDPIGEAVGVEGIADLLADLSGQQIPLVIDGVSGA